MVYYSASGNTKAVAEYIANAAGGDLFEIVPAEPYTSWPTDSFVKANDFFCTSSSSGLGESGELLSELAGTGNWLEGRRFRSGVSQSDVQDWVQSLDI